MTKFLCMLFTSVYFAWQLEHTLSSRVIIELSPVVALKYFSVKEGFGQHLNDSPTFALIPQILHTV